MQFLCLARVAVWMSSHHEKLDRAVISKYAQRAGEGARAGTREINREQERGYYHCGPFFLSSRHQQPVSGHKVTGLRYE